MGDTFGRNFAAGGQKHFSGLGTPPIPYYVIYGQSPTNVILILITIIPAKVCAALQCPWGDAWSPDHFLSTATSTTWRRVRWGARGARGEREWGGGGGHKGVKYVSFCIFFSCFRCVYDFFNRHSKCHKIVCFESSVWQIERLSHKKSILNHR